MSIIRSQCKDDEEYLCALRDEFAAKAMQGMYASSQYGEHLPSQIDAVAAFAYQVADAMFAARKVTR
ncbi:MAG: hypothetical protein WC710_13525 [Gallionella sp.]|jgi:hypothetical protein